MELDALAFGAHPDDVELSCGGTLIALSCKGYRTGVISLTRAELGTRGTPEIRAQEFAAAAEIMELAAHKTLSIPDGRVGPAWENKLAVIREIREWRPKLVFAPYWEDRHPDHANTSLLVREAAFLSGLKKIETGQPAHRPNKVIYYPCRIEFTPSFIVDVTAFHERKMQSIRAYQSQFHHEQMGAFGEEETNISHSGFLETIVSRARMYGSYIGVKYGEPFLLREPLHLDDPVRFFQTESLRAFL